MTLRRLAWIGWLLALAAALVVLFLVLRGSAQAEPLEYSTPTSQCRSNQFDQSDIAGTYEYRYMYVQIHPCGGVILAWTNDYGEHVAGYISERRILSGGVVLAGWIPDDKINAYMDSTPYAAFTPAEPGWVYLTTLTDTGQPIHRYRLMKTS